MPTQVKLGQMVDLALGTPEVGAVNFNVLHTLLHAMLKKLSINDVQAEISEFDRDFLSSSKLRQVSGLSDLDSGKGDDSEDAMSEKSTPSAGTGKRTPYHQLEMKVAKISEQLENFSDLPTYKDLFERLKYDKASNTPVADMWKYINIQKDVEKNSAGVDELMKLVQKLMQDIQRLEEENKKMMNKISGLNIEDLMKKLKELEERMNLMNEKFNQLPTEEEWSQFVTWPGLEDALNGVKKDWENIQPQERVVIEMSSQTEPQQHHQPSRPVSSRASTRMSASSPGPSAELLDILERLGKLSEGHEALTRRVDAIEEELKNKLDKSALENLNLSSDLLEKLGQLRADLDALAEAREKDSDALSRAQQAILQLQAEVEKLHDTTKDIIEENNHRQDQIDSLFKYCDKLQEVKADKEYVQMEVDVKADKRSLDNKVNHTLFDSTTNEINKMIKDILDKLAGHEESWNSTIKKFAEDIDGKLDRLELDPLKEWLESRLKALNDKLRKQQAQVEWTEDDAAGIRKQLIQRFHCISCDRPVDLVPTGPVPALPTHSGLPPTRSPRPYTTFELDQIRQHAKSFANAEVSDYYATARPCGGSHTMTYPHKRITRLTHLSHLFREEDGNIYPIYKEEVDVQGADGHIYKGRMGAKLEARLPVVTQSMDRSKSPVMTSMRKTTMSPPPGHRVIHQQQRPSSARIPHPRASSKMESPRPQSAHPQGSREGTPRPGESSHTIPAPPESPVPPETSQTEQARIEVPIPGES